jgi:hypothetical protein
MSPLLLKEIFVNLFSAAVILSDLYFLKTAFRKITPEDRLQEIKNYRSRTREQTTSHLYWNRMRGYWDSLSD